MVRGWLLGCLLVVFMTLISAKNDYEYNDPSWKTTIPIEIREKLLASPDFLQSIGHIPMASRKEFEENFGSTIDWIPLDTYWEKLAAAAKVATNNVIPEIQETMTEEQFGGSMNATHHGIISLFDPWILSSNIEPNVLNHRISSNDVVHAQDITLQTTSIVYAVLVSSTATDGTASSSNCANDGITALTTCTLRSAWAWCLNQLSSTTCGGSNGDIWSVSCTIILPSTSTSRMISTNGGALAFSTAVTTWLTSCQYTTVGISITSPSALSKAAIVGDSTSSSLLYVSSSTTSNVPFLSLRLENVTISNFGNGAASSAVLFQGVGTVVFRSVQFASCMASGTPGSISIRNASQVMFIGCVVQDNINTGNAISTHMGGAVGLVNVANVVILKSLFYNNRIATGPRGRGGAVFVYGATNVTISSSTFGNNTVGAIPSTQNPTSPDFGRAGALGIYATRLVVLSQTMFVSNTAFGVGAGGGAIDIDNVFNTSRINVVTSACSFTSNSVGSVYAVSVPRVQGGAMRIVGGPGNVLIANSMFTSNQIRNGKLFSENGVAAVCDGGGAIYTSTRGSVALTQTSMIGNYVGGTMGFGGGIYTINAATFTMTQCSFSNNTIASGNYAFRVDGNGDNDLSGSAGGAVSIYRVSKVSMSSSTFMYNYIGPVRSYGGAVAILSSSYVLMSNCNFTANKVISPGWGNGGAVMISGNVPYTISIVWLSNSMFTKNYLSSGSGGALMCEACMLTLSSSTFIQNSIGGFGGALMAFSASVPGAVTLIQDCKFLGNSATSGTGAVALCLLPQAVVIRCDFTNNKNPGGYGGALGILFWGGANSVNTSVISTTFHTNTAGFGGAVYIQGCDHAAFYDVQFIGNSVVGGYSKGGAIYLDVGSSLISIGGLVPQTFRTATNLGQAWNLNASSIPGGPVAGYYAAFDPSSTFANTADGLLLGKLKGGRQQDGSTSPYIPGWSQTQNPGINGMAPLYMPWIAKIFPIWMFRNTIKVTLFPMPYPRQSPPVSFIGNTAGLLGGALYVRQACQNVLVMPGVLFQGNTAGQDGGAVNVFQLNNYIYFFNNIFVGNKAGKNGGAMAITNMNWPVNFYGSAFTGNSALNGGALYFGVGNGNGVTGYISCNAIKLENISITNNSASGYGGGIYSVNLNSFLCKSCLISSNIAGQDGGGMYAGLVSNSIRLTNTSIVGNHAGGNGGGIALDQSNILTLKTNPFIRSNTAGLDGGGLYSGQNNAINTNDIIKFNNNSCGGKGGAVSLHGQSSFTLGGKSYFSSNLAVSGVGGGTYVAASSLSLGSNNVSFVSNKGGAGSAMYVASGSTVTYTGTSRKHKYLTFVMNACTKHGGTIFVEKDTSTSLGTLSNSSNLAVQWLQNTAPVSPQFASQAVVLSIIKPNIASFVVNHYYSILLPQPTFALLDGFGVLNITDSSTIMTVAVNVAQSNCSGNYPYVSGTTIVTANNGQVAFNNMTAFCFPGGNLSLIFTATPSGFGNSYSLKKVVMLQFRSCVDGEILVGQQCMKCPEGSYSFTYSPTSVCTKCPANTLSCSGNIINMLPGYWRISPNVVTMMPCTLPFACGIGSDDVGNGTISSSSSRRLDSSTSASTTTVFSPTSTYGCQIGYMGPLCAICWDGWFYAGTTKTCQPCGNSGGTQLMEMIVIPLSMVVGVALIAGLFSIFGGKYIDMAMKSIKGQMLDMGGGVEEESDSEGEDEGEDDKKEEKDKKKETEKEKGDANEAQKDVEAQTSTTKHEEEKKRDEDNGGSSLVVGVVSAGIVVESAGTVERAGGVNGIFKKCKKLSGPCIAFGGAVGSCFSAVFGVLKPLLKPLKKLMEPILSIGGAIVSFVGSIETDQVMPIVKILMSVFQMVSSMPGTLNLQFPKRTTNIFNAFTFVNFTSMQFGSPQCFTKYDYIDTMMVQTLAPLFFVGVLFLVYLIDQCRTNPMSRSMYVTTFFLVTYTVLPSVTTTIFGTFGCVNIDPDNLMPGTPTFMYNDYTIACNSSRYTFGVAYAVVMIMIYPVGVMSMYYYFLSANKEEIMELKEAEVREREEKGLVVSTMSSKRMVGSEKNKPDPPIHPQKDKQRNNATVTTKTEYSMFMSTKSELSVQGQEDEQKNGHEQRSEKEGTVALPRVLPDPLATPNTEEVAVIPPKKKNIVGATELNFLYKAYEGHVWYWEVVETARRLLLTAIISVMGQGTAEQIVFGIVVSLIYIKLYGYYAPFDLDEHDVLQEVAQFQVFFTLFIAFCIRLNALKGPTWASLLDIMLVVASLTTSFTTLCFVMKIGKPWKKKPSEYVMSFFERRGGSHPVRKSQVAVSMAEETDHDHQDHVRKVLLEDIHHDRLNDSRRGLLSVSVKDEDDDDVRPFVSEDDPKLGLIGGTAYSRPVEAVDGRLDPYPVDDRFAGIVELVRSARGSFNGGSVRGSFNGGTTRRSFNGSSKPPEHAL